MKHEAEDELPSKFDAPTSVSHSSASLRFLRKQSSTVMFVMFIYFVGGSYHNGIMAVI
jgi:hypothetical protein